MADEQRIAVLEQHVRKLYEQVGALREELRTREGRAPEPAPTAAAAPAPNTAAPEPAPRIEVAPAPPPPSSKGASRDPHIPPRQSPEIDLEMLFGRYGTIAVASL